MDCAGCGACCDPVWLPLSPDEMTLYIEHAERGTGFLGEDATADVLWFRDHFTGLGAPGVRGLWPYECDAYDRDTGLCTAHDDRPPICRNYPWYAGKVKAKAAGDLTHLVDGCSHVWDLPPGHPDREAVPVERRLLPLWPV